jgi:hypothetical protein
VLSHLAESKHVVSTFIPLRYHSLGLRLILSVLGIILQFTMPPRGRLVRASDLKQRNEPTIHDRFLQKDLEKKKKNKAIVSRELEKLKHNRANRNHPDMFEAPGNKSDDENDAESEEDTSGESEEHTGNESEKHSLSVAPRITRATTHPSIKVEVQYKAMKKEEEKSRKNKSSGAVAHTITRSRPATGAAKGFHSRNSTAASRNRAVGDRRSTSTSIAPSAVIAQPGSGAKPVARPATSSNAGATDAGIKTASASKTAATRPALEHTLATTTPVAAEPPNQYILTTPKKTKSAAAATKHAGTGIERLSPKKTEALEAKAKSRASKVNKEADAVDLKAESIEAKFDALDAGSEITPVAATSSVAVAAGHGIQSPPAPKTATPRSHTSTTCTTTTTPTDSVTPERTPSTINSEMPELPVDGKQHSLIAANTPTRGLKQVKPASAKAKSNSNVAIDQEQQPEANISFVADLENPPEETNGQPQMGSCSPQSMRLINPAAGTKGTQNNRTRASDVVNSLAPDVASNANMNVDAPETTAQKIERMKVKAPGMTAAIESRRGPRDPSLPAPSSGRNRKRPASAATGANNTHIQLRPKRSKPSSREDATKDATDDIDFTVSSPHGITAPGPLVHDQISARSSPIGACDDTPPLSTNPNRPRASSSLSSGACPSTETTPRSSRKRDEGTGLGPSRTKASSAQAPGGARGSTRHGTNTRQRWSGTRDDPTSDEDTRRPLRSLDVAERRAQRNGAKTNSRAGAGRRGGRDTSPLAPRSRDRVETGRIEKPSREQEDHIPDYLKNESYTAAIQKGAVKDEKSKKRVKELKKFKLQEEEKELHVEQAEWVARHQAKKAQKKRAQEPKNRYKLSTHDK